MTGQKSFDAILTTHVASGGRQGTAQVTATCNSEALTFDIVYAADFDKTLGFQETQPDASVSFNQIHIPTPRVDMRVRVDQGPVHNVSSETDHANEAKVFFTALSPDQAKSDMNSEPGTHDLTPLFRLLATARSSGTIDEAYSARSIKIELPLANGDTPI